jgi:phosphoribosyl 1,2-cyclic phosphate phosphodiesterase
MTIDEAVAVAAEIAAPLTYLTHLTHLSDHAATEAKLPLGVRLAYDGLRLQLGAGATV